MNEIFYEESAVIKNEKSEKTKYNILNIISIFLYAVSIILLFFTIFNFKLEVFSSGALSIILSIVLNILPIVFSFLLAYFLGKTRDKFFNEFDYTFVSGSIRISKVIMHKKRKFLFKFDCAQIERMGSFPSPESEAYLAYKKAKVSYLTNNAEASEDKSFYYIIATIDSEKTMLVLECTKMLMVNILSFSNKSVWEKVKQ